MNYPSGNVMDGWLSQEQESLARLAPRKCLRKWHVGSTPCPGEVELLSTGFSTSFLCCSRHGILKFEETQ